MNLQALREEQDIISALYGQRILPLDSIRCNMTENRSSRKERSRV